MPTPRILPSVALLVPLAVACATDADGNGPPVTQAPGQAQAAAPVAEVDVEVDERPPLPLDQWRAIKQEGEVATREVDLEARIAKCRAFAKAHPDHQATAAVLESLADSLVEKGGFDPAELAGCLEAKAALEDGSSLPSDLVERYHLKHDLPVDSGLRLLDLARKRLAEDEQEIAFQQDERTREWMTLRLAYQRANTHAFEARLQLRDGKLPEAMRALERGHAESSKIAKDILVHDAAGKPVRTLAAGVLEELHVLTAEVHHRQGDDAAARESMAQALGFTDDLEIRGMYDRLRDQLGLGAAGEVVTAAAQPAQEFALEDLSGKKVKLSDFRGKVVLVTFWATWCGPCKKEMPELQKFQKAHADKGVVVLAVNIDDFNSRSKIKPFLAESGLTLRVLLEDPAQLTGYDYSGIPALYVIDREGRIAHARTGYDAQLKEKLAHEIKAIVESKGGTPRELLTIEQAPAGFGVLWKQPVSGDARALAVAAPLPGKGAKGEVAAIGRDGLMRWSADGKAQPTKPLTGWSRSLHATDLDGDGKREWIVGGWQDVKVLDQQGELYWEHSGKGMVTVAAHHDLDGDGSQELVLQDGDRVIAMKAVPDPLWTSAPFESLEAVRVDPAGGLVVQADGKLVRLSARGKVVARGGEAPEGRTLSGRIDAPDGVLDVYEGQWDPTPILEHDIDGDGRDDLVVPGSQGIIAYDAAGQPILRVRSHDVGITAAVGDLDGKPGDELVLFVEHYGVVVLGRR